MINNFYKNEKILKIVLLIIGAGLIVCIFLIIFYVNWEVNNLEKEPSLIRLNNKKTEKSNQEKIILPKVIYSLAGTIKEINWQENYIMFEVLIPESEKDNQIVYRKEIRKVLVTPDTKINKLIFLVDENNKKTIQEAPLSFKDLKLKDYIEAIANQDISTLQEFSAVQIRVQPY